MNSNRFVFAILALTVCAGLANAQNIHPDISSQFVKATVDPSVIKGPIKPMNAVNNGPNVGDDPQQMEDFHELYAVAAKYLKKRFPDLKIGGPSYCRILRRDKTYLYFPQFFEYMHAHDVPIDFITWHKYDVEPAFYVKEAYMIRDWMKQYGYEDAAFVGAVMCAMQDAPVDMLMYYDFRVNVDSFCGFYDPQTRKHMPTYYVFYAWNKLRGNQCECTLEGGEGDIYAVAAVKDGKTVLMLNRYNGDNNTCNVATVNITVKGYTPGDVVYCHLTDVRHNYTEIPLFPAEDGTVNIRLVNN